MSDLSDLQENLNVRNIKTLAEMIKIERSRVNELHQKLDTLNKQFAMQQSELASLRQQVSMILAMRGRGPTGGN